MKITEEMVDELARLARLSLEREERTAMTARLEQIVDYMGVLSGLDEARSPLPDALENVFREDEPVASMDRAALLACAPASDGETYLVPRTVE